MPDKRQHRGPHPDDNQLFSEAQIPTLRAASADYALLLTKGYPEKAALKLVGDHFRLTTRQRLVIRRSTCSDQQLKSRKERCLNPETLQESPIAIDGYNTLITCEVALSGGYLFEGRDGCIRDLAGLHGTYRKVQETSPAINLIGRALQEYSVGSMLWLIDQPVSNSGRLTQVLLEVAQENAWDWEVRLFINPDAELRQTKDVVMSTDSVVLDRCQQWCNLMAVLIQECHIGKKLIALF